MIVWLAWKNNTNVTEKKLNNRLLLLLLLLMGTWGGRFIYFIYPDIFVRYPSLHGFPILCLPVAFYAYIRRMIYGGQEKPVWKHYIAPLLLAAALTPSRQPEAIQAVTGPHGVLGMHRFHLIFSVIYGILVLGLFYREYKRKKLFSDASLMPAGWFWVLFSMIVVYTANSSTVLFESLRGEGIHIAHFIPGALLSAFLTGMVLYQVICRDLYLFTQTPPENMRENVPERMADSSTTQKNAMRLKEEGNDAPRPHSPPLTRQQFERHVLKGKLYLRRDLSLTALARLLDTNRTYLSAFVNREYGMNFSQYINSCRLKEFKYLESSLRNEKITVRELAVKAGFGTYEGYLKARKKAEEALKEETPEEETKETGKGGTE